MKNYNACLTDIALALEAGYPTNLVYKLYIRQCKCLLEQCKIQEAQAAFDRAIDAIDRSGLKKDTRKETAAGLQEAFINLAKSVEADPPPEAEANKVDVSVTILKSGLVFATLYYNANSILQPLNPPWSLVKEPHETYPAASSAISMKYDPLFGRHMVANRDIAVGEVIFSEHPIVSYLNTADENIVVTPACHHCLLYINSALVPCPTCNNTSFCRYGNSVT